jgi:ATP-dependent DNA helicase RecG
MATGDAPLTLNELAAIPVERLKGIGPKKLAGLAELEIDTVLDLLTHYPRRYIDRTKEASIASLEPGEEGLVLVSVVAVSSRTTRTRKRMVTARVTDGSGQLTLSFFGQPWRERQLTPGLQAVVFGKMEVFGGRRTMTNPVVDLVGDRTGRIVPVYPQSEKAGLHTWDFVGWVADALRRCAPRGFAEPLPPSVREQLRLVDRGTAIAAIHEPETMADQQRARQRLVFDELLRMQLLLVRRKRAIEASAKGVVHRIDRRLVDRFHERLAFPLTAAQVRAVEEILADMARPAPMHRLLQGDVGAGKTIVAVSALLAAVEGGHQGAFMAPTEVLAEQHAAGVAALLRGFTVVEQDAASLFAGAERELRIALLTNRTTAGERRRILADLASGGIDILIGTHALIQEGITFASLGMVVIDEQHRFGVEQRAALRDKGEAIPDVLVMTATPIPRTAAMTVYGDLDVSVLDELPPGRTPITTLRATGDDGEAAVWAHVRREAATGHQAYVVCPLIDESGKLEVRSAQETYDRLTAPGGELADLRVGLLHGRLSPADKDQVMTLFRAGALDALVATTVIEVGVDVPDATTMVVLDAARFGIAQLHQLRGRVGRGTAASTCWLVGEATTPDGEARLDALVATTDGFALAEVDLDLRGEGTLMGERQKGRNDLKLASLRRDRDWVQRAREVAVGLLDASPDLAAHPALAAELDLLVDDDEAADFLLKN